MASDKTLPSEPTVHEMGEHVRDYEMFVTMFKWGAIISFVIAMILLIFVL